MRGITLLRCGECSKVLYSSVKAARAALTNNNGGLRSKRVRCYTCPSATGKFRFHVTTQAGTGEKHASLNRHGV